MKVKNILKKIGVIQEVQNKNRNPKLGRGFLKAYRLNPWNPLSYVTILLIFIIGIVLFGVYGFWKEIDNKNPFKWD